MQRLLIGLAVGAGLVGLLLYATLGQHRVECSACVRYEGREACRSAAALERGEAEQAALSTACALVTGGVTETLGCLGTPPVSLTCVDR